MADTNLADDLSALGTRRGNLLTGASTYYDQLIGGSASSSAATTYENIRTVLRKPIAGRIRYKNNRTGTALAAVQFAVGVAAAPTVSAQNLTAVTWGGAATPALTVAPNPQTVQQAVSDVFPITAVARTDGFPGYLLALRTLIPQDANTGAFTYAALAQGTPIVSSGALPFGTRQQAGDFVTTNQAGFTNIPLTNSVVLCDIELFYEDGGVDLLVGVGDSITGVGEFSNTGYDGFGRKTVALLNAAGARVDYFNSGWGGQISSTYFNYGLTVINALRPRFASYAMCTPNEVASDAVVAAWKARVFAFIEACRAVGTTPILVGPSPRNDIAVGSATATYLLACRTWLQTLAAKLNLPFLDLMGAMGDPATGYVNYLSGYAASDGVGGIHPTDAGYAAAAQAEYQLLRTYYGL